MENDFQGYLLKLFLHFKFGIIDSVTGVLNI